MSHDDTPPPSSSHRAVRPRQSVSDGARRVREPIPNIDYQRPPYPHGTHPALVPGISLDEQRRRYGLGKTVFTVAGLLTVAFVIWGVLDPSGVSEVSSAAYAWTTANLSWLFNSVSIVVLFAMLLIALSPFGRIPLGKDGERPEYSTFSWVAMLFAAGLGIGVLFWGPSEPLAYFLNPPPHTNEPETAGALHYALSQTYFHWGFHAWAMYALIGGAVAYGAYRRGRALLMSSMFRTLFGARGSDGFAGKLVDMFAVVATLFGTAAALGIAVLQIGAGVQVVTGLGELTNTAILVIIGVLSAGFVISAVSGVSRGIRYLSNINIVLTVGIVALILFAGPTLFLLNMLPSAVMEYLSNLFEMMGKSLSWGEETAQFQSGWTVYYWAWWISWSPFVGVFIARISRGRTIRQFLLGTIFLPSALIFGAFGIMGGTAMWMRDAGLSGFEAETPAAEVYFTMLGHLPGVASWLPLVSIVVLAIFFITAADSASVVMGMLSSRGNQEPKKLVVVFWGVVMAGIALVMLLMGNEDALAGLQQLVIITAVPFALVMLAAIAAWVRDLQTDPSTLRDKYADTLVQNAVREGVGQYGDDFALQVVHAAPGEGAGADVDSTASEYTDWYQRTDEDGNPVDYDYTTGTYADGWTQDEAKDTPKD